MMARGIAAATSRALALGVAVILALTGCGTARPDSQAALPPPSMAVPLTTSLATGTARWAVVRVAASPSPFWEIVVQRPGQRSWSLVTPPGVADNGGVVVTSPGAESLTAAFRPSEDLKFTPLAVTRDAGASWSPGLLDGDLAAEPDAMAAAADGRLLALAPGGTVWLSAPGGIRWRTVARERPLKAMAGRACGLVRLTAVAFTPAGEPLLAGACARDRVAIFADRRGAWRPVGPMLPAELAGHQVEVLRMTAIGGRVLALLVAGAAHAVSVTAAWTGDGGDHWGISPPLPLRAAHVQSVALSASGAAGLVLTGGRAVVLDGPGTGWRWLPALPAGTVVLALGPAGEADALASRGARVTTWRLASGRGAWARVQALRVPPP